MLEDKISFWGPAFSSGVTFVSGSVPKLRVGYHPRTPTTWKGQLGLLLRPLQDGPIKPDMFVGWNFTPFIRAMTINPTKTHVFWAIYRGYTHVTPLITIGKKRRLNSSWFQDPSPCRRFIGVPSRNLRTYKRILRDNPRPSIRRSRRRLNHRGTRTCPRVRGYRDTRHSPKMDKHPRRPWIFWVRHQGPGICRQPTRWAPTCHKWSYNPDKWPYKWVYWVISPYLQRL